LAQKAFSAEERLRSAPDRILVKFKKMGDIRTQESVQKAVESSFGIQEMKRFSLIDVHVYRVLWDKERTIAMLNRSFYVEYAEPDYFRSAKATLPNDPRFGSLWGHHNTGQNGGTEDADIDAPEAWELTTGSSNVIVAVIDSGIDYNHEDLRANLWRNPGEILGNEIDDDGNGYVDDFHGIDALDGSGDPMDDDGHGTHVAGTIAAVGNNGIGVTGVCWSCKVMALRFLSRRGDGTVSDEIECIQYAVNQGVKIINGSFGEYDFSRSEKDAIDTAREAGVLFVFAAGNTGEDNDTRPHYPSAYDSENIIAVGASNRRDQLVFWSDYGLNTVDVAAPGAAILSTYLSNAYQTEDGTSMAAPYVAGLAALLKSSNSNLNWQEIKNRILNNGDRKSAMEGKVLSGSRMNAYKALSAEQVIVLIIEAGEGGNTNPLPGTYNYDEDDVVSIWALPDSGFEFSRWSGSVSPGQEYDNPITIQMNSSKAVKANFRVIIHAPLQLTGQKVENRSLSQREYINVLNWQPHPNNSSIAHYRLYEIRGPKWNLLADVNASTFFYWHRKVEKDLTYLYAVVAVNNQGREGAPTYVTVY
jgi:hypothetical protein